MNTQNQDVSPTLSERYTAKALSLDIAGISAARGSVDHNRMTTMAIIYPIASVMVGFSVYRALTEFMECTPTTSVGVSGLTMLSLFLLDRAVLAELVYNSGKRLKALMWCTRSLVFSSLVCIGVLSGATRFSNDVDAVITANIKSTFNTLQSADKNLNTLLGQQNSTQESIKDKRADIQALATNITDLDKRMMNANDQYNDELRGKIEGHSRGNGDIAGALNGSLSKLENQRINMNNSSIELQRDVNTLNADLAKTAEDIKSRQDELHKDAEEMHKGSLDRLGIAIKKAFSSVPNAITFTLFVLLTLVTEMLMFYIYMIMKDDNDNGSFRRVMVKINEANELTQRIAQRESFSSSLKPLVVRAKPLTVKKQ